MNQLNTTLISLSFLIENLNRGLSHYSRLMDHSYDYLDLLRSLHKQTEQFLLKLMNEYKRLSNKEYIIGNVTLQENLYYEENNVLDVCMKTEEEFITIYSEILRQDILWEVLPVLAQQLMFLNVSKNVLASNQIHA